MTGKIGQKWVKICELIGINDTYEILILRHALSKYITSVVSWSGFTLSLYTVAS